MSRKVLVFLVAVSIAGLYGCGDDNKKKDEQPQGGESTTCEKNYCNGNISVYCVGDKTQSQDCGAAGCNQETGLCNTDTPQKCDKNYCNGNISVYCVGKETLTLDCGDAGCNADTGLCNGSAQDKCEKSYCNGSISVYCVGNTAMAQNCGTNGCNENTGLCNPPQSAPKCENSRCNGDISIYCLNGQEATLNCGTAGCNAETGMCNGSPELPKCSKNYCNGDVSIFCLNGTEMLQGCGAAGCNAETGLCNSSQHQTGDTDECSKNTCNGSVSNMCVRGVLYPSDCGTAGCNELTGLCNAPSGDGPAQCTKSECVGTMSYECINGTIVRRECGALDCNDTTGVCNSASEEQCTKDVCSGNLWTRCVGGVSQQPMDCGIAGCNAETGQCNTTHGGETPQCTEDACGENNMLNLCVNGRITPKSCGSAGCDPIKLKCNEEVVSECTENDNKCISDDTARVCKNGTLVNVTCGALRCNSETGFCNSDIPDVPGALTYGGNVGDACDTPNYKQSCMNNGSAALYCDNGTVKQLFCSSCQDAGYDPAKPLQVFCENGSGNSSDLTEGGNVGDSCSRSNYKSTCINNGANALVCWNNEVTQWDCSSCEDAGYNPEKPLEIKCVKRVPDLAEGGEIGDACSASVYKQTCINGGANALVCWNGQVAQWDCSSCENAGYNPEKPLQVSCKKPEASNCVTTGGTPGVDCCNVSDYQVSCTSGNAHALLCSKGMVKQWDCANNECSVSENQVTCPKPAPNCVATGGNPGDCCDESLYQNTCTNANANALVCRSGKIKEWTCADNHCAVNGNEVDCPKTSALEGCVTTGGQAGVDCCDKGNYVVSCINQNANALICAQGMVKEWTCADSICSVTDNKVYCPSETSSACVTEGGEPGVDCCDKATYQVSCIDGNAHALICNKGKVMQWTCANNVCSVENNYVTCPKEDNPEPPILAEGGEVGDLCSENYKQSCNNSILKMCIWAVENEEDCGAYGCSVENGVAKCNQPGSDCVEAGGEPGVDCCDASTYQVSCINNNANALICAKGMVKQWNCADNICSIADNKVNCPEPQNPGCAATGGNEGECCQKAYYQVSCNDNNSTALICSGSKIKKLTCAPNSCSIDNNYVNCPEPQNADCAVTGGNVGDCCQKDYYQVSCSDDHSTALYCSSGKIKQLTCATNSCTIENNYVTCK